MGYEESLRQITIESIKIRRNEAVKAGLEVVFVEVGEIDILIDGNYLVADTTTTEEVRFVPPVNINDVTQALEPVGGEEGNTQKCVVQD